MKTKIIVLVIVIEILQYILIYSAIRYVQKKLFVSLFVVLEVVQYMLLSYLATLFAKKVIANGSERNAENEQESK